MHRYELKFLPSGKTTRKDEAFESTDAASAMHWAERKAHGCEFEIHQDGRKLSTARLSRTGNFWTLSR